MNYQFAKTVTCKLAAAAMLGCSCCSTLILGQQLTPVPQAEQSGLPPIVRASEITKDTNKLPPIVPIANVKLPEATPVQLNPTGGDSSNTTATRLPVSPSNSVRGKNFPANASEQIAEFIRSNATTDVENTPFVDPAIPESNRPSHPIMPLANAWPQDGSPSDLPTNIRPREVVPAPGLVTPYDIPAMPEDDGGWLPNESYPMSSTQATGGPSYFEQPHVYDSTSEYGGANYSPASIDYGASGDTFACCGFITNSSGYTIVDGLYWNRSDGTFRAGNFTTVDDFDWTWGGRVTIGKRRDSTRGWEASYMQFDPWIAVNSQSNAAGQLFGAVFTSPNGLPVTAVSAFRNSTFLEQFHKTDLHGLEINKTYWGADVAKAFLGARYIYFDDEFHLSSANTLGQQGIHNIDTTNNMFGVHIGGEVLYDIGYRLSFSASGKVGGYANFNKGRVGLLNNNTIHVSASRNDTDFSASAEIGVFARLKLGPRARLRAGYEAMTLINVYEVESNYSTVVLPTAGQNFNDGDAFFHGLTMGFEIFR